MTYKETYKEKCKKLKNELERIKSLGGNVRSLQVRFNVLINRVEAKLIQQIELSKNSLENVDNDVVYTDALHELTFITEDLSKYNAAYEEVTKTKEKLNLLNIDEILKTKNNNIQVIVKSLEQIMITLKNTEKYFPDAVNELQEKLYTEIYKVIKAELSNTLNSKMLGIVIKHKEESHISPLIQQELKSHLKSSKLKPEEHKNLYILYEEYSKQDNFTSKETILFIVYLQDRNKIKRLIEEHYYKLYADVVENSEFLGKHFNGFEEEVSNYKKALDDIKEEIFENYTCLVGRITAFALSITILVGAGVIIHKSVKSYATNVTYPTTIDRIIVKDNKEVINTLHNEYMGSKIEDLHIIADYTPIFYDAEGAYRFKQEYGFDYVNNTPLEDYVDLSRKNLKPLDNYEKDYTDICPTHDAASIREITVYNQDLNKPDIDIDENVVLYIDIILAIILSGMGLLLELMPLDNLQAIFKILGKKRKNKKDYKEIIDYLTELKNEIEKHNIEIQDYKENYDKLIALARLLGITISENEIETEFKKNESYSLKLKAINIK